MVKRWAGSYVVVMFWVGMEAYFEATAPLCLYGRGKLWTGPCSSPWGCFDGDERSSQRRRGEWVACNRATFEILHTPNGSTLWSFSEEEFRMTVSYTGCACLRACGYWST
jgi:hypothetical protein